MSQQVLFKDVGAPVPETEGVKYAGSKLKLLPYILEIINDVKPESVFDGFSGSTRVSQALAKSGYAVISNDISAWSKVFGLCYLKNKKDENYYKPLIKHLNSLPGKEGWFTENYHTKLEGSKKPWKLHNLKKLDSIRDEIDELELPETETSVLITSLILGLDEVDSTLGHFASYLSEWSPRSHRHLRLRVPLLGKSKKDHQVFCGDIFKVLGKVKADLAYFDPPYGSNNEKMPPSRVRYSAYYHLWTTICLNDRPAVFGKANRRVDSSDTVSSSIFEEFRKDASGRYIAVEAIEKLIKETNADYILLSYSSGGRATANELESALESAGEIEKVVSINHKKNVMASMRWTNDWIKDVEEPNKEYLFLLRKN